MKYSMYAFHGATFLPHFHRLTRAIERTFIVPVVQGGTSVAFRLWAKWPARALGALTLSLTSVFSSTFLAFANVFLTNLSRDP
jgi:hypothetical protein